MFGNEECSSGCESGWTLYLQQSSISTYESPEHRTKIISNEDEDLSMVSDASSGPPQLHEEEGCGGNDKNNCFFNYSTTLTKPLSKTRENRCRKKVQELDDTASSQLYNVSSIQSIIFLMLFYFIYLVNLQICRKQEVRLRWRMWWKWNIHKATPQLNLKYFLFCFSSFN